MPFTDSGFLLLFLPAVLGLYFVAIALAGRGNASERRRFGLANGVLVIGSLWFLAGGGRLYAAGLGAATLLLVGLGTGIDRAARPGRHDRLNARPEIGFALGLTGLLLFYGLSQRPHPIADGGRWLATFADHRFSVPGLLMPLGLSVFVCHAVSFLVDIYRRRAVAPANPVHAAMYLLAFPFLVAGPIVRYRDISPLLATRQVGMAAFAYGVRRFTIGLGKVALIAQTLAGPAEAAFAAGGALGAASAWIGLVCFSLQIYFDLSGYADMALGIGRMLGFRLPENFGTPYSADTLHDFWRRWNVSLTAWCDTYLRLSLRPDADVGVWRRVGAVGPLFVVIGLWYGPSWGGLVWGAGHALFIELERTRWGSMLRRLPAPVRHAYVLLVVAAGWIFFRAATIGDALLFFQALGGGSTGLDATPIPLTATVWIALAAGVVAAVPVLPTVSRWSVTVDALATALQMIVTTAAMFVWARLLGRRVRREIGPGGRSPDTGAPSRARNPPTTACRPTPATDSARDARGTGGE